MTKFSQAVSIAFMAAALAGLSACGEEEKAPPPPPPPPAPVIPLTIGGSVSGLAGGEVVLRLNGDSDLTVRANGQFKFPSPLQKGASYAVTVKTQPSSPVRQTCTVSASSGTIAARPVGNVGVSCSTNHYAVGGTVKGLRGRGLVLELDGSSDVTIEKSGDFIFPDARLADGADYRVAIKSAPAGQRCEIEAVNTARDLNTINIVAVTCAKRRR